VRLAEEDQSTGREEPAGPASEILHEVAHAEGYVASVCFKTGPPQRTGVELEWTVHHADDPVRPVAPAALTAALGPHAPPALHPPSPHLPLPAGGVVTIEPGGQLEISTPPARSLAALHRGTDADIAQLTGLLAGAGLVLGRSGIDQHRPPRPFLDTPRYAAMARAYDRRGPHGQIMMRSTAGLQVCLDAGEPAEVNARWAGLHALGPPLLAVFANARRLAGRDTGSASARMANWFRIDPSRTRPAWTPTGGDPDPARAWARYAVHAELLCVPRRRGRWDAPPGVTFADWIDGALPRPPTVADLDYHLGTLFPPVRPRGYLEVRYLDAQPPGEWLAPVAVFGALTSDAATLAEATELCAPAADRWVQAAHRGLADRTVAAAGRAVLDLACRRLDRTDLPAAARTAVSEIVRRRLDAGEGSSR
jgi:glutamate--cysteine ligase